MTPPRREEGTMKEEHIGSCVWCGHAYGYAHHADCPTNIANVNADAALRAAGWLLVNE